MLSMFLMEVHCCNNFHGIMVINSSICNLYVDHIKSNYKDAIVVFDGYKGSPSTKDTAHIKGTGCFTSIPVKITEDMMLTFEKGSVSKKYGEQTSIHQDAKEKTTEFWFLCVSMWMMMHGH